MKEWLKPEITESEAGMEVTSYLPAELDRAEFSRRSSEFLKMAALAMAEPPFFGLVWRRLTLGLIVSAPRSVTDRPPEPMVRTAGRTLHLRDALRPVARLNLRPQEDTCHALDLPDHCRAV